MELQKRLRRTMLYAGVTKEDYERVTPRIRQRNYSSLCVVTLTASLLLGAVLASSFAVSSLQKNRTLYCVFFVLMAVQAVLAHTLVKQRPTLTLPAYYLFLGTAFLFAAVLGVPLSPEIPGTTFCVLLFALPLLIIDKPYRLALLLVCAGAVYSVMALRVKAPHIAALDVTNVISFCTLGVVVNYYALRTKVSEVLNRAFIERERDTDSLTGLMTKAAAKREIEASMAAQNGEAALLVLDIDNFKRINDTLGHAYGDAVIRIMGECISATFRASDILARFGGDEFVLYLPGIGSADAATARVERLIEEIDARLTSTEKVVEVTGSIGIAFFPADATAYDELFARADEALYRSKANGKNCYSFYFDEAVE